MFRSPAQVASQGSHMVHSTSREWAQPLTATMARSSHASRQRRASRVANDGAAGYISPPRSNANVTGSGIRAILVDGICVRSFWTRRPAGWGAGRSGRREHQAWRGAKPQRGIPIRAGGIRQHLGTGVRMSPISPMLRKQDFLWTTCRNGSVSKQHLPFQYNFTFLDGLLHSKREAIRQTVGNQAPGTELEIIRSSLLISAHKSVHAQLLALGFIWKSPS